MPLLPLVAALLASQAPPDAGTCRPDERPRTVVTRDGHAPGLYVASANLPRVADDWRRDACAATDARTLGANIVVPWSKIDRGERDADGAPILDWSYAEAQVAPWAARGQKVNLLLWASAQRTFQHLDGEPTTPAYVLAQVPTVRCYRERGEGPGWRNLTADDPDAEARRDSQDVDVPIHWDERYQALYRPVVAAFVRRFEDEPYVNYLRVGVGVGAESYPANGVPGARGGCRDEWEAAGLTPAVWTDHVLGMIDYLGSLEPRAPFVVTLNELHGAPDLPRRMAGRAVEVYGFGIGSQGATARAIEQHADPDRRCYAEWCSLFERYRNAGVPLELQTPRQSDPDGISGPGGAGSQGLTGPLPPLLDFALERGATSIELYPFEWSVANGGDPEWSAYQEGYDGALTDAAQRLATVPQRQANNGSNMAIKGR